MSDGLLKDEFANRPDDPELAFVYFEKIFRVPLDKALADLESDDRRSYNNSYNHCTAANDEDNFRQIKFDIDGAITQIKVRCSLVTRKNSVNLEGETREKIRDLVNKIMITIESVDIPVARKESLMNKLNAFAAEVDRDRTRFEAFGALVIEASGVVAKVEKKLRPVREWLGPIAADLHEANTIEDAAARRLTAPARRIQAPPRRIAPPDSGPIWDRPTPSAAPKGGDLDDEIPF